MIDYLTLGFCVVNLLVMCFRFDTIAKNQYYILKTMLGKLR